MINGCKGELGEVERSDHHKHMDYVQAIITRLANNSFLMKGWALTLSSALLGFAIAQDNPFLSLAALVPLVAFWLLDAYYLCQERAFRKMYSDIAGKKVHGFEIDPTPYAKKQPWTVFLSVSLSIFYPAIVLLIIVVTVILSFTDVSSEEQNPPSSNQIQEVPEVPTTANTHPVAPDMLPSGDPSPSPNNDPGEPLEGLPG